MKICRKCSNEFSGRDCMVCHKAYYVLNAEKVAAYKKQYNIENKESIAEKRKAYREENKEKVRKQKADYAAKNSKKIVAKVTAWCKENPNRRREYSHNYRARKKGRGVITPGLAEKLMALQKGRCACCGLKLGKDYHMDHIMPLALGGSNSDENMQLLRSKCNMQKNAKHPVDFMQQRGFLL